MPSLELFHVDAFTRELFRGNPAGVCVLERWLPEALMQAIAAENNWPETAFVVPGGPRFLLRWFTPAVEVPLCGHATLAAAHVLWNELGYTQPEFEFETLSGRLRVKNGKPMLLDLPASPSVKLLCPADVVAALGAAPVHSERARYWICEFESEADVLAISPDFRKMATLERSVVVTARASTPGVDFVSRFFAGPLGVDEDPVTGSAHADLTPYWSRRLGKDRLIARQLSKRGGELECYDRGDRVELGGYVVTYLRGTLRLPVNA
jgi:predicted PhzF superfamily epimerase YddE/YHI9